jgi:hypothetical protein
VSAPLRIGVDGGCWLNRRGYGRYTRNLLSAMARLGPAEERYYLLVDPDTARSSDLPARFEKVVLKEVGSPSRTRTCNPPVNSRMLYH